MTQLGSATVRNDTTMPCTAVIEHIEEGYRLCTKPAQDYTHLIGMVESLQFLCAEHWELLQAGDRYQRERYRQEKEEGEKSTKILALIVWAVILLLVIPTIVLIAIR